MKRLERDGLVGRRVDMTDSRVVLAPITGPAPSAPVQRPCEAVVGETPPLDAGNRIVGVPSQRGVS